MRKLTFEDVKTYIESAGHILLDNVYTNDHTKLNLKCPANHTYSIILNSFKNGRRCSICKGLEATKRQRAPYEAVLKMVQDLGREIITTKEEYEANYTKENKFFFIKCVCGKPHKTTRDRLRKKCLCRECSNKKIGPRSRTPIEKVRKIVESKGQKLNSDTYENDSIVLSLSCDKGHSFGAKYADIKRKEVGCRICKAEGASKRSRTPYKTLVETADEMHLEILMKEEDYNKNYKSHKVISMKCRTCDHRFSSTAARINQGTGCQPCGTKRSANKRRKTYEQATQDVEKLGYKLITDFYTGTYQEITVLCPKHGKFQTKLNSISNGHGCRNCSHTSPKAQQQVFEFVKYFYPDTINNTKKIISPLELDIYIPSLNFAVEYCGVYWHSEEYKEKNTHYDKMKMCNEKGIRLITIFEDEWIERQDQVKNFLLSSINKNSIRLMGRKTEIKEVPKTDATAFLEQHHIQGSPLFEVAFGLYHDEELQAVITGNKHHRQGFDHIFVLNRLAFKSDVSISGGSSKLLKALLNYAKNNHYSKLISWSDNRWSQGNVYNKLGFALTEELGPDYSYVKKQGRVSKQSCKKKNLLQKGAQGTMENTERELALTLGLWRIWDCGKKRWEIDL
jgi:hypothetical protein